MVFFMQLPREGKSKFQPNDQYVKPAFNVSYKQDHINNNVPCNVYKLTSLNNNHFHHFPSIQIDTKGF